MCSIYFVSGKAVKFMLTSGPHFSLRTLFCISSLLSAKPRTWNDAWSVYSIQKRYEARSHWSKTPIVYMCMYSCQGPRLSYPITLWWMVRELWFLDQCRFSFHISGGLVREEWEQTESTKKYDTKRFLLGKIFEEDILKGRSRASL